MYFDTITESLLVVGDLDQRSERIETNRLDPVEDGRQVND